MPVNSVSSNAKLTRGLSAAGSPTLRAGSRGTAVADLQSRLLSDGFDPGAPDGVFGARTAAAVRAFQAAHGLNVDGVFGPNSWSALTGASPTPPPPGPSGNGQTWAARGTGYYPDASAMEGGFTDRRGHPLCTLQDYLAGRAPYVSVAMDATAFPYGTRLRIPELEQRYGRQIDFRVVDTGGAFRGKGTSRIDICTASRRDSLDPTINGPLHLLAN